jgi:hypothetical protein
MPSKLKPVHDSTAIVCSVFDLTVVVVVVVAAAAAAAAAAPGSVAADKPMTRAMGRTKTMVTTMPTSDKHDDVLAYRRAK